MDLGHPLVVGARRVGCWPGDDQGRQVGRGAKASATGEWADNEGEMVNRRSKPRAAA